MTQSVLESMARAVYDITYGHSDPTETPFAWSQSVSAARAALIALRDGVTDDMLDYDATDKITGSEPWNPRPSAAFPLIINHVLQEGEKDTEGGLTVNLSYGTLCPSRAIRPRWRR